MGRAESFPIESIWIAEESWNGICGGSVFTRKRSLPGALPAAYMAACRR